MVNAVFRPLLTERARPDRIRELPHAPWLAVLSVCFGAFMGQLDASIVTVAFPAMRHDFHASVAAVEWGALAYMVTLVALLAAAGRISDALGRKLLYMYGFGVFTVASLACGLAPGLGWLLAGRVVQAVGAAMMQANSVALITTTVPRRDLPKALGIQGAAQALGLALGPAIGGLLVATGGWRLVFWVNVPIGVVALLAGHYLLPRSRERHPMTSFDWPGALLLALSAVPLLLALSGSSGLGLSPYGVVALLAAAVVFGHGFVRRERHAAGPLVELSLLRGRTMTGGLGAAFAGYLVLFALLFTVPLVLDGSGPTVAGLVLTALPAGFAVAALLPRRSATIGLLVAAAGLLPLLWSAQAGLVAVALAVSGLGLGVFTPANNATVMGAVPPSRAGVVGGLVNTARGLGTALGIAGSTLILHLVPGPGNQLRAVAILLLVAVAAALAAIGVRRPANAT